MLDHGDQMALAARIAARHPQVGLAERGRYNVVLLDEYQDTSHAQLVLLRALFGGGHPVTAVGDPCQSIYGWRGASAGNLRRFAREFPGAPRLPARRRLPAPVKLLSTSFRNTGRVLEVAAVLQRDGCATEAPTCPGWWPPPGRAGRGAVVCALLDTVAARSPLGRGTGRGAARPAPGIAPDGDPWDGRGPGPPVRHRRAVPQAFPVRPAAGGLEARGVPVEVVGLGGLLTVPEVADIVATLRVLHDPAASAALARLLTGPRWRIGPRDLVALGRRARDLAREPYDPAGPGVPGPQAGPAPGMGRRPGTGAAASRMRWMRWRRRSRT